MFCVNVRTVFDIIFPPLIVIFQAFSAILHLACKFIIPYIYELRMNIWKLGKNMEELSRRFLQTPTALIYYFPDD